MVVSVFVTAIFAACSSGKQSKSFIIESLSITIVFITDFTVQSIYFFHFISGNSYSTHSFVRGDNSINRRYWRSRETEPEVVYICLRFLSCEIDHMTYLNPKKSRGDQLIGQEIACLASFWHSNFMSFLAKPSFM